MSMHRLEDLTTAGREINPEGDGTLLRFTHALLEKADARLEVSSEDVTEVVMNWPGGCEGSKRDYLRNVGAIQEVFTAVFQPIVKLDSNGFIDVDWSDSLQEILNANGTSFAGDDDVVSGFPAGAIMDGIIRPTGSADLARQGSAVLAQSRELHRLASYMADHQPPQ